MYQSATKINETSAVGEREVKSFGIFVLSAIALISVIMVILYVGRFLNATTMHTEIVSPSNGISCYVVSASDSVAVDCWKDL